MHFRVIGHIGLLKIEFPCFDTHTVLVHKHSLELLKMASICWLLLPACHPATLGVGGDTIAERDDTKSTRVTAEC